MIYKYDEELADLVEEQFRDHNIDPYFYHFVVQSLSSDNLAVQVACQRMRFIKKWPTNSLRLDCWAWLRLHLDNWVASRDNVAEHTLLSVMPVGLNECVPYFMNGIQMFNSKNVCALIAGLTLDYQDAGWCEKNLSQGNFNVLKSWFKSLVSKTPDNRVYGYAVEALKCFANESNLDELIPYMTEAYEAERGLSAPHALIALKILVKTFGKEKVLSIAEKYYEHSKTKSNVEKAIDTWLKTTYLQNKSNS